MDDEKLADVWMLFKEYLDKKHIEMAAERYVDLMADYGVSDETFKDILGTDGILDAAISYYLDIEVDDDEEAWDE
tara:strand:- start:724 stop:948 length:225 start_codon:yes stop_codon:yes gene_type:complete